MYSENVQRALDSAGAKPGDRVRVVKGERTYEGILLPRPDVGDADCLVPKLQNGYKLDQREEVNSGQNNIVCSDVFNTGNAKTQCAVCAVGFMQECYRDPYLNSFKAKVVDARDGVVLIEPNYFFSASGGQASDRGEISWEGRRAKVVDVVNESGKVLLKVDGDLPKKGEEINCVVDWERRYALMKAHTAEHMLFQALSRTFPGIYPEKVSLEPNSFSLFVRYTGSLDWNNVLRAEKMVNQVIREARPVHVHITKKSEVPADVRIKMERIEDEEVRIIEVEGFDKVACSGLHIKNTNELGVFCVSHITSDKPGVWKIDFLHGSDAVDFLLDTSKVALSSSQILGTNADRLEKTAANLLAAEERLRQEVKELSEIALAGLKQEEVNGTNLYLRIFSCLSQKLLQEWAGKLVKKEKTIVVFAVRGEKTASIITGRSRDLALDMRKIGEEAFRLMDGKGGGSESFVSGSGDPKKLDEAIRFIVGNVKR